MSRTIAGQPVLLVDMDGVLANWIGEVTARAGALARAAGYTGPMPAPEQLTNFRIAESFADEQLPFILQAMSSPGLFRALKPFEGAMEALRELDAAGVHVAICSSPDLENPTCADDKLWWVGHYGGSKLARKTILTKDKTTARGALLVDDKPVVTGQMQPVWRHVVFTRPYNLHIPGLRLDSWADWPQLLPLLDHHATAAA